MALQHSLNGLSLVRVECCKAQMAHHVYQSVMQGARKIGVASRTRPDALPGRHIGHEGPIAPKFL
jgi:hypothetical protein